MKKQKKKTFRKKNKILIVRVKLYVLDFLIVFVL